jgi:phosphate transport system protein
MHIRERFEHELEQLNANILHMMDRVEEQMTLAVIAYDRLDPSLSDQITVLDREINRTRFEIEEKCLELIAMQQPAARDLRLIVAAMNMIVDLERMGDQAKGVNKALHHMHTHPMANRPAEIQQMGQLVLDMLRQARQAYTDRNLDLARIVAGSDDEVDKLYAKAFTQIMYRMADANTPEQVEAEYELLRIAREFERFGDLVTNIAERAVFLVTGTMYELNLDPDTQA